MGPVLPERFRGSRAGQTPGTISYQARSHSRADGKWIYPFYADGTINICRTSAFLDPAVQGQSEVVASLTHIPSSCRATGEHSITPPGQKKPKWVLRSSSGPFPTSFLSAALHPKFSPLRVHILGALDAVFSVWGLHKGLQTTVGMPRLDGDKNNNDGSDCF